MPRRSILSTTERNNLLALPAEKDELIRLYTFNETDLAIIRQHRRPENRLGFAIQLCYMRYPGVMLGAEEEPFAPLLCLVAAQLKVSAEAWENYGKRSETHREHALALQSIFDFHSFTARHYRNSVHFLHDLAWQTDKGIVLAAALVDHLRHERVLLPSLNVIERICAESITQANRKIYSALTDPLSPEQRKKLDLLLKQKEGNKTWLFWLRQTPLKPNSRHMLEHIERLKIWKSLDLPAGIHQNVHQNRLLKIAREGAQMTSADLSKFETQRRYATLAALAIEGIATITDEIIDLHDRIIGKLFNSARQKHQQEFQASGKAINDKVRLYGRIGQALIEAKHNKNDPFSAIESILPWESFIASVNEAQKLAQPEEFDFLHHIGDGYTTLRRYVPAFLEVLQLYSISAAKSLLNAIDTLRDMNAKNIRQIPKDAPTDFIKPRWNKLITTESGIDRRYYELCALSELKNALRSGDVWAQGSRQFKNFDEYLMPVEKCASLKKANALQPVIFRIVVA